jgi:signal transduction histidine kinase
MNGLPISLAEVLVGLYLAQITAFSLCILLLGRALGWRTLALWLSANAVTAFTLVFVRPAGVSFVSDTQPLAMSLIVIGANLRFLAFAGRRYRQKRLRVGTIFALVGTAMMPLCYFSAAAPYRLLILCTAGLLISVAIGIAIVRNPIWRGLPGQRLMFVAMSVGVPGFVWRLAHAYPFGDMKMLLGNSLDQIYSTSVLIIVSFLYQLGFIVAMRDRAARVEHFAKKRLSRAFESTRSLHESNKRMGEVAEERLRLLNILTHEVRQPLNNAQAAFSNIHMQLEHPTVRRERLSNTVARAQDVLDGVTLALSNAIVGATVIERGAGVTMAQTSAIDVARLALEDCPAQTRKRIELRPPKCSPYVQIDPVVVRLALRNLLDNACKFSPPSSPILFEILLDEDRCGVAFRVTNVLADKGSLNGQIFERHERGVSAEVEGKGLGLFIVKQVARIHHGEARCWIEDDGRATFELFLRD